MAALLLASASIAAPPNVLLLWVDDVGYGDIGFNGNATMKTPHLDKLAASGTVLSQHLVASPICTPSRAALIASTTALSAVADELGVRRRRSPELRRRRRSIAGGRLHVHHGQHLDARLGVSSLPGRTSDS